MQSASFKGNKLIYSIADISGISEKQNEGDFCYHQRDLPRLLQRHGGSDSLGETN